MCSCFFLGNNLLMRYFVKTKRKELILLLSMLSLMVLCIATVIFANIQGFSNFWFYIFVFYFSVYMFVKSYVFRSDSSLYLATLSFCLSVAGGLIQIFQFSFILILSLIIFCFSLSHLSLFLFFNKSVNFVIFIFLFLLFLPLILYAFYCINWLILILLLCGDALCFCWLQRFVKYE